MLFVFLFWNPREASKELQITVNFYIYLYWNSFIWKFIFKGLSNTNIYLENCLNDDNIYILQKTTCVRLKMLIKKKEQTCKKWPKIWHNVHLDYSTVNFLMLLIVFFLQGIIQKGYLLWASDWGFKESTLLLSSCYKIHQKNGLSNMKPLED